MKVEMVKCDNPRCERVVALDSDAILEWISIDSSDMDEGFVVISAPGIDPIESGIGGDGFAFCSIKCLVDLLVNGLSENQPKGKTKEDSKAETEQRQDGPSS